MNKGYGVFMKKLFNRSFFSCALGITILSVTADALWMNHTWAMDAKPNAIRVIVDKTLMTQVQINDATGEIKFIVRDPKSQVKEFYFYNLGIDLAKLEKDVRDFYEKIPFIVDDNGIKGIRSAFYTFLNGKFTLMTHSTIFFSMKKIDGRFSAIYPTEVKYGHQEFWSNSYYYEDEKIFFREKNKNFAILPPPLNLQAMDKTVKELEQLGVNREILFKYVPGNLLITPENEMRQIVKETIKKFDFSFQSEKTQDYPNVLQTLLERIMNYKSEKSGSKTLGEQIKIGNFPIESEILLYLVERLKMESSSLDEKSIKNILYTALELSNLGNGKYRLTQQSTIDQDVANFAYAIENAVDLYIIENDYDILDLTGDKNLEQFFQQFQARVKDFSSQKKIPVEYYFAKNILSNPKFDISDKKVRVLLISLLRKIEENMVDPNNNQNLNLPQFAFDHLAKLNSYEIHDNFKNAPTNVEKCNVLKKYLCEIQQSDRNTFSQELIDQNIGSIALGEGLTFDFPILTNDAETCVHLMFHLCGQKSELNPALENVEIVKDENCTLIEEMASLIQQISQHSILLEKLEKK